MTETGLNITFEGRGVDSGVPLDDLQKTLQHMQRALRLMVGHFAGIEQKRGRPPKIVRQESMLRLRATSPGSLVTELVLYPPIDTQRSLENYGQRALNRILDWQAEDESFPETVADELRAISRDLSLDVSAVRLGDPHNGRFVEFRRTERGQPVADRLDRAFVHGWMKEVNWDRRTAQLHRSVGNYIQLRFDATHDGDMLRLATQYVEVRGPGRFNNDGDWTTVQVKRISGTRSGREPFDLDEFMNDPNPKIFDPEKVVTASEPFDVDEFVDTIHEGRDVGREEPLDCPLASHDRDFSSITGLQLIQAPTP